MIQRRPHPFRAARGPPMRFHLIGLQIVQQPRAARVAASMPSKKLRESMPPQ
nr:hypothetical protein [Microbacterium bovistercoris]